MAVFSMFGLDVEKRFGLDVFSMLKNENNTFFWENENEKLKNENEKFFQKSQKVENENENFFRKP